MAGTTQDSNCICGLHAVTASSFTLQLKQQHQLLCTLSQQKAGVFAVENLDSSLPHADSELCLQQALNAVSYWLDNSIAFQDELAKWVVDYDVAELPISAFVTWCFKKPLISTKNLTSFFQSNRCPLFAWKQIPRPKYDKDCDLYGVFFDPDNSDFIYLNSALIKKAKASQDNSLPIFFLIFVKVVHEFCHWITHFTMKRRQKRCTPTGFFDRESGECMEKAMFRGIVSHHSKSALCPWEVELVVKSKIASSQKADLFHVDYMKLFL
ncbi:hypothetical protein BASA62_010219 [Batrachochytrium salamandrivorans]|nr:hypothetical protein BASA62_010219 [Batrachochytrium salamandrivorans]